MKKKDYIALGILILSPILVNLIVGHPAICTVYGDLNGWIGFYGSFVAAIIPMFILYRTRTWNKEDNEDTRKMQYKTLQYQAKQIWLENFRKQLDANYRIFDFHEIGIVVNDIRNNNYQMARWRLMQLSKNVELQANSFDLYLWGITNSNKEDTEYIKYCQKLIKDYGMLVNDLIIICNIGEDIKLGKDYKSNIISYINNIRKNEVTEDSEFIEKISHIVCENKTPDEVEKICEDRILGSTNIHMMKKRLIEVTYNLLKTKVQEIENILKE